MIMTCQSTVSDICKTMFFCISHDNSDPLHICLTFMNKWEHRRIKSQLGVTDWSKSWKSSSSVSEPQSTRPQRVVTIPRWAPPPPTTLRMDTIILHVFEHLSISTTFKINNPPAKTGNSFLDREGGNLIERKKIKKLSAFVFASLAVPWNNQNIPAQPRLRFYQTFPYLISHGFQFLQEKWKSIVL